MKRPRVTAAAAASHVGGGPRFYFSPPLPCEWVVEKEEQGEGYVLRLRKPFLPLNSAGSLKLVLAAAGRAIALVPHVSLKRWFERSAVLDRVYHAYETHSLAFDEHETTLLAVYVRLDGPNDLKVDAEAHWMSTRFAGRFTALPWFPTDVDPRQYGLKLDSRRIPQRTPLWFALRGTGGSTAYVLLGYWVPSEADEPDWRLDGPRTFNDFAKSAMALGTQSENPVICGYLVARPGVSVSAVGWCDVPPGSGCPRGWGASPDALLHDPGMTADSLPADITKYLTLGEWDVTRGVLEIKTSRKSLSMEPYFLPQVYLEMIATHTLWCDVVRYRPNGGATGAGGTARVYRIYRHQPTEQLIVGLMKIALATPAAGLRNLLLTDERWIKAREYLAAVAKKLAFSDMTMDPRHEAEWKVYRESLFEAEVPPEEQQQQQQPARGEILRSALKKLKEAVELLETL